VGLAVLGSRLLTSFFLLGGWSLQGFTNHAIISAAKGGVEGMARALAAELAPAVRVNVVAPSLSDTPLAANMTKSEAIKDALAKAHPIPRLGTGGELAGLCQGTDMAPFAAIAIISVMVMGAYADDTRLTSWWIHSLVDRRLRRYGCLPA
jgi:NAD(P)-dependent dehydrogenase (short-subunit alcohol dehydrogenase family)